MLKTYCVNADCPFKKCDKHLRQLKKIKDNSQYIKVASFDSVCEDYLHYLLDEIEEGGQDIEQSTKAKVCNSTS